MTQQRIIENISFCILWLTCVQKVFRWPWLGASHCRSGCVCFYYYYYYFFFFFFFFSNNYVTVMESRVDSRRTRTDESSPVGCLSRLLSNTYTLWRNSNAPVLIHTISECSRLASEFHAEFLFSRLSFSLCLTSPELCTMRDRRRYKSFQMSLCFGSKN